MSKAEPKQVGIKSLSPQQVSVLGQRIKKYEKGQMTFSSWTMVRNRITRKNAQ
jgi:hypothetical protein